MDLSLGLVVQISIYALAGSAAGLMLVEWFLLQRATLQRAKSTAA